MMNMSKKKQIIVGVIVVAVLAAIGLFAMTGNKKQKVGRLRLM